MNENVDQTAIFTIHYEGDQISDHKMKLEDFIFSLQGFDSLLKEIAQEIGIPKECLQLQIQPLENGGIKTYIVAGLIGISSFVSAHLGDHLLDDIHLYEHLGLSKLAYHINSFLNRKKSVSNYKDFQQLTIGLDLVANHIMMNKEVHAAAEQFTSSLQYSADSIEITSTVDSNPVKIAKKDFDKFQNPFIDINIEENILEEEKVLRLEGPRYSEDEWIFYEKDSKGNWNKDNTLRAIVLDKFLLSLGRDNSLSALKDKDLFCTVRCKEIIKPGNKKKTIQRYIIYCRLNKDSLF